MDEELYEISEEIFAYIISKLTFHLRFMDPALNRYVRVGDSMEYGCDGMFFHYSPIALIRTFTDNPAVLTRGYLHVVLHSVFRHMCFAKNRRMSLWDLACDMAVENVIEELGLSCAETGQEEEKRRLIAKFREKTPAFTAQRIYHVLEETDPDEIRLMGPLFAFDSHEIWYETRDAVNSDESIYGEEDRGDPSGSGTAYFEGASHDSQESAERKKMNQGEAEIQMVRNALKDWKEISEKIETDLETFHKEKGDALPALVQSLEELHREKYSYREFLKRFMKTGEKLKLSDEDFDPVFYTYGLKLYKNLPLIEPLEFQEVRNIRELVIAIDTSGSVQGRTVQSFLEKTWNIFQEKENFFTRFRIHIVQCDMVIREAMEITSLAMFDRYIRTFEIRGLGGTDFRPVFEYVQNQIDGGVFRNFGGLLYFTDGDGVYPKQKPSYSCAFLFPHNNKDITVPPWAIRYSLKGDI